MECKVTQMVKILDLDGSDTGRRLVLGRRTSGPTPKRSSMAPPESNKETRPMQTYLKATQDSGRALYPLLGEERRLQPLARGMSGMETLDVGTAVDEGREESHGNENDRAGFD